MSTLSEQSPTAADGHIIRYPRPAAPTPNAAELQVLVQQVRDVVRYVDNARDAALLVRRANAVGKLVDEALKGCRLLEEQQFELRQDATEAHLRTQRRAGELLAVLVRHPGGRPGLIPEKEQHASNQPPTLRELGISGAESHRWQRIAKLPMEFFEQYIRDQRLHKRELTTSGVLVLAKRVAEEADEADTGESLPSGKEALLHEYDAAKGHISNIIWLDPIALTSALDPVGRRHELDRLRRWRIWLEEFEQSLMSAGGQRLSVRSVE
jgi:hypothetical protein